MNDFQKRQREKTIAAVTEAAERLQANGVKLTIRSIAEEADLSVSTVSNKDIKLHLYQNFPMGERISNENEEISKLREQLNHAKERLKHTQKVNSQLREKIKRVREERDKNMLKYRHLLLQYAINIDKTTTPL